MVVLPGDRCGGRRRRRDAGCLRRVAARRTPRRPDRCGHGLRCRVLPDLAPRSARDGPTTANLAAVQLETAGRRTDHGCRPAREPDCRVRGRDELRLLRPGGEERPGDRSPHADVDRAVAAGQSPFPRAGSRWRESDGGHRTVVFTRGGAPGRVGGRTRRHRYRPRGRSEPDPRSAGNRDCGRIRRALARRSVLHHGRAGERLCPWRRRRPDRAEEPVTGPGRRRPHLLRDRRFRDAQRRRRRCPHRACESGAGENVPRGLRERGSRSGNHRVRRIAWNGHRGRRSDRSPRTGRGTRYAAPRCGAGSAARGIGQDGHRTPGGRGGYRGIHPDRPRDPPRRPASKRELRDSESRCGAA
ncbi:hypothetical protein TPAU25S_00003 [Tsukamurella paurometabola]